MKFKQYSFKELLSNIVDNRGKTCPTADQGLPLIATNCINNKSLYPVFEKVRYVNVETYKNWFRGHPKPEDIIFVCKGSPGRVAWVKDPVDFCIAQDMVSIRADRTKIDPKYLFALLRSDNVQQKISNMHVGSLIPHFKKGDFGNLYLDIPEDLEYQKMVGEIYFNFSMKIEQNNKINQTLESIAQALFKSWFIDFDPVRAKIAAKQNGADPELAAMCVISGKSEAELKQMSEEDFAELQATAALFPAELMESELGKVPNGWLPVNIEYFIELIYGKALKKTERIHGVYPVYGSGGLTGWHNKALVKGPGVIIGRKGTIGSIFLENKDFYPIDTTYYVKTKNNCSLLFAYYLLQTLGLEKMNTDAAVPGLNRQNFYHLEVPFYSSDLIEKYTKTIENIISKNLSIKKENEYLIGMRDSLLPKLLSGEVALGDVIDG